MGDKIVVRTILLDNGKKIHPGAEIQWKVLFAMGEGGSSDI
jgi:hypothetical protein